MKYALLFIGFLLTAPLVSGAEFTRKMFEEAVQALNEKGVHKLSQSEIYEGAIRGVLDMLEYKDNPQWVRKWDTQGNVLLDKKMTEQLNINSESEISGVGIEFKNIQKGDSATEVLHVFNGGAKDAGVRKGDALVRVENRPLSEFKDTEELAFAIRGQTGTKIRLAFLRNGQLKTFDITRKKIKFDPATYRVLDGNIGYLEIRHFSKRIPPYVKSVLGEFKNKGIKKMVLDFRTCGGGYTPAGRELAKMFAKNGDKVFGMKQPDGTIDMTVADSTGPGVSMKIAILVGHQTDGTTLAVIKSIREKTDSLIFGTTTGTKGSRQELYEFPNGYNALFTTAMMVDSQENVWNGKPLIPDVKFPEKQQQRVERGSKEDTLLNAAQIYLSKN